MSLLITMLPLYLFGNLHCIGMCGPLVMMLGKSPFRHVYFLGRVTSFTLAGALAGAFGAVLNAVLSEMRLSAITSFFFGSLILTCGAFTFFHRALPGLGLLALKLAPLNQKLTHYLLKGDPKATFLFGFFTILLPCGQTLIVYSACALSGDLLIGMINGFAFSLITSPSLFLAMQAEKSLHFAKQYYNELVGIAALFAGSLALLRGLAEIGLIQHLVLNSRYHIVLY